MNTTLWLLEFTIGLGAGMVLACWLVAKMDPW